VVFPVEVLVDRLPRLAEQRGDDAHAIDAGRCRHAGDVAERRQDIPVGADEVTGRTRLDPARPAREEWDADPSLVYWNWSFAKLPAAANKKPQIANLAIKTPGATRGHRGKWIMS